MSEKTRCLLQGMTTARLQEIFRAGLPVTNNARDKELCEAVRADIIDELRRRNVMPYPQGFSLIRRERLRQIQEEGYDAKNDDKYVAGELCQAAIAYIYNAPHKWPWTGATFKRTTHVRDLVKAGALIAAEIDRRLRAGESL